MTRALHALPDEKTLRGLLAELGHEARAQRFEVAPNPCVGAAVLAGGREIARGFHTVWGGPHAEVEALDAAARSGVPREDWDTLVITLEPCSSHGKTPPCTDRVLADGIRRVVVGELDPDPRHRGAGLELLRERGVEVVLLNVATPLSEVAPHFLAWTDPDRRRRPRPWVVAKWAQTRSGQLVPPEDFGEGRWISGPESLREVHRLRGRVDAIVTGVGTVLADDPRFTVRPPGDPSRPPRRVVLDSVLRTPPDARLFAPPGPGEGGGEVVILHQAGQGSARAPALEAAGARLVSVRCNEQDHVELRSVLSWLWDQGARRVLVEAGPTLLSRFLETRFVDQLRVYTGNVSGGRGDSMAEWLGRLDLRERLYREVADDSVLEAFLKSTR